MNPALTIEHPLCEITIRPREATSSARLTELIQNNLDSYQEEKRIPASVLHAEGKAEHGDYYRTPGYYLRLYRQRLDMPQVLLSKASGIPQRHVSEMENNKRALGKAAAKKLAAILKIDYRKLL